MLEQLQALFNEYTGRDDITLREDSVILRDFGLNSYELVTLVCEAEERFGVQIPDRLVAKIRTVGDFMRLLEKTKG
ncbi:MAG: phosphopantetheine-binding protein [Oscillospiraceae bacterium]|jgi:acyl carrier protein|nr:phosphopantetheine-binding protein [Oscillospiraceae bacterium]